MMSLEVEGVLGSAYQAAPPIVQQYLTSDEFERLMAELQHKFGLHADIAGKIEREIILVLLGAATPKELTLTLTTEACVPNGLVAPIIEELNQKIFLPLRAQIQHPASVTPAHQSPKYSAPGPQWVNVGAPTSPPSIPPLTAAAAKPPQAPLPPVVPVPSYQQQPVGPQAVPPPVPPPRPSVNVFASMPRTQVHPTSTEQASSVPTSYSNSLAPLPQTTVQTPEAQPGPQARAVNMSTPSASPPAPSASFTPPIRTMANDIEAARLMKERGTSTPQKGAVSIAPPVASQVSNGASTQAPAPTTAPVPIQIAPTTHPNVAPLTNPPEDYKRSSDPYREPVE